MIFTIGSCIMMSGSWAKDHAKDFAVFCKRAS
jgi:hypothetical protein